MSKKLLMNKFSENGLMPVTDGLICWLDGRDYVTGENVWKDRSEYENNAILENHSGVQKNNSLYFQGYGNIKNPTLNLEEYTIELYMKDLQNRYWNGLWGNYDGEGGNSFVKHDIRTLGSYPYGDGDGYSDSLNIKSVFTFVYRHPIMYIYIDNTKITTSCNFLPSLAKYFVICARKPNITTVDTNWGSDARLNEWYSYKIYNRALTEEEIQQNYLYEHSIERGQYYVC